MSIEVIVMPANVYEASDPFPPRWRFLLILHNQSDTVWTLENCEIAERYSGASTATEKRAVAISERLIQGAPRLLKGHLSVLEIRDPSSSLNPVSAVSVRCALTGGGRVLREERVVPVARRRTLALDFPLDGRWVAANARADRHGVGVNFAFDFVMEEDMPVHRQTSGEIFQPWDFASFGRPLYSPVDGIVVACESEEPDLPCTPGGPPTFPDGAPPGEPRAKMAGNYVMLQLKDGTCVMMCHIQERSVQVRQGQSVVAGERIGSVGNSGNTTGAHLHIEVLDGVPEDLESLGTTKFMRSGVPFGFRNLAAGISGNETEILRVPAKEETVERAGNRLQL